MVVRASRAGWQARSRRRRPGRSCGGIRSAWGRAARRRPRSARRRARSAGGGCAGTRPTSSPRGKAAPPGARPRRSPRRVGSGPRPRCARHICGSSRRARTLRRGARSGPCPARSARRKRGRAARSGSRPFLEARPTAPAAHLRGDARQVERGAVLLDDSVSRRRACSARRVRPALGTPAHARSRDRTGRRAPPGWAGARSQGRARPRAVSPCGQRSEPEPRWRSRSAAPRG